MDLITICGNTGTILSSFDCGELPHETREDLAREWCEQVASAIRAARSAGVLCDYEVCHDFAEYHGGRFAHQADRFGNTGGRVSYRLGAPQSIRELAEKAEDAADAQLEESIAEETKIWAN